MVRTRWNHDWELIVGGVALLAIGLICLFFPNPTLVVLAILCGAGFLVSGIGNIGMWLRTRTFFSMSTWSLLFGILQVIVGLIFVLHPAITSVVLPWVAGTLVIVLGAFELAAGVRLHATGLGLSAWPIVGGVLTVVIGLLFFAFPDIFAILLGLTAVMQGITLIVLGTVSSRETDVIDL